MTRKQMSDLVVSHQMMLVALGYEPTNPIPLHPIAQELLDYVNSPEYAKLERKDQLKIIIDKKLNFHTTVKQ